MTNPGGPTWSFTADIEGANVFGCYGGSDSFNLDFVKQVISGLIDKHAQIYFLFMNIDRFIDHPQAIFLTGNPDPLFKSSFINTCDAMIHARGIGESFGLLLIFKNGNRKVNY